MEVEYIYSNKLDDPSKTYGETCNSICHTLDGEWLIVLLLLLVGNIPPDVTISGGGGSSGSATASMEDQLIIQ